METKASSGSLSYSSLLVPSVQELAKNQGINAAVPPRYVREDSEPETVSEAAATYSVPVIDMQRLLSEEVMALEIEKLHLACKDWGFFQLVNHGVSTSLVENMRREMQGFFNLPVEEKKKFWQRPGDVEGFGQAFVVSEEQKLDWADLFFIGTHPPHIRKPHLFPLLPLPFRDILELYSMELKNLANSILAQMAKALKMDAMEMIDLFGDGAQFMRMNCYPPCPHPEQVIGLTPHSDASGLTILLQANEVEGLQVRKDGMWVPIKALPGAFVVNIGDILEIVSNGTYRSIEHRVTVNSEKERLSIATFYQPRMNGEIGPAPSLTSEQRPAVFTSVGFQDYLKGLFSRPLQGKAYLEAMRIQP